ncbi:MAG: BrnA antitoxin family protein [Verrucomicrobia bacterium]|nr:BrnA antitoxin family protein [Verrucomicrobiota bacterium]MCH8529002.1 BrnA antitoxin family protein [Kiritimatiellia bacterium]
MKTQANKIPHFKSEADEREFWAKHDSAEYINWKNGKNVTFPNLKPSLKSISIRLPESMIEQLKVIANKKDVPYQSLVKRYLSEKVREEMEIRA